MDPQGDEVLGDETYHLDVPLGVGKRLGYNPIYPI